ncbi:MAG: ShlB/FhaC/HecB family hemolysin secretion/activation protein [Akkermansiaceae bacterium]|nr:ShlB/FhaC/HecB family hemolysin secretion/activation protein [Akkermansiaceae bacterium]MCP5542283.1 ShlB/FhaC/HecB family hemolysin secretion/activation protein [Akkermansiaceae bacterium]MCP5546180.1 ShlB/FhaC/HecB family hemolysin secretion/activation protein [Akkermansiaceae bacterium]
MLSYSVHSANLPTRFRCIAACCGWAITASVCTTQSADAQQDLLKFYVRSYKVSGNSKLSKTEIESAVYPFMGPGRSPDDVEQARQALEKAFQEKGYQTVSVSVPDQDPRRGIIRLEVTEGKVARVRVTGSRWFLPSRIKRELPSIAEGSVPDFERVGREMVAVNRMADRRITPEVRPGAEPGSIEVDLNVEDKLPLHGSFEFNNRYSAGTTPWRINGALSYGNLFQLGHTLSLNAQIAPENTDDGLVYSASYLARVSEDLTLMLQGTRQDSDISTLGGAAVAGKGEIIGVRAMFDLPTTPMFYQSINLGIDYKSFDEDLNVSKQTVSSPIEYYPISANYYATWMAEDHFTEFNTSLTAHLRGMGSDENDYANKRYNASGSFIYLRGDASHTHDIKGGAQVFGKIQGQVANQPLINNEQISGGGLGTVRGYLEATALGDNGVFGTLEYRTPTLIGRGETSANPANEWRFHAFADAGLVGIYDPLPGQKKRTGLSSVGIGSRATVKEHFHGSVDVAVPLIEQPDANDGDVRVTFRGWADF